MKTLKELFLNDLAEIHDAELRLAGNLPRLAGMATSGKLRDALLFHLKETQWHVTRIGHIFDCFMETPIRRTCKVAVDLLRDCEDDAADYAGSPAVNAALIAAMQKIKHYEMASLGCLYEWADMLNNRDAAATLRDILRDVQATDDRLTDLALSGINEEALAHLVLGP